MKLIYSFGMGIACMGCAAEDTFLLTGKVPDDFRGQQLVVVREEMDKVDTLASCSVVPGGTFELKGKAINKLVSVPALGTGNTFFYAETGKYAVEKAGEYFYLITSEGENVQTRLADCLAQEYYKVEEFSENSIQLGLAKTPEEVAKGEKRYLELMEEMDDAFFNTLKTFQGTELAVDLLYDKLKLRLAYSYLTHCLEAMGDVPEVPKMDSIMNYYEHLKVTQPLGKAPAFALPDKEGNLVSLSDYAGKYVLLNFWASTCGPCRIKMRVWEREHRKFEDLGVEILSVSCDSEKDDWLKAVEHDKVSWIQLLDREDNPVNRLYGMEYLSDSYLISPEGMIVGKNLSWEQIENTVKQNKSDSIKK